jgi:hypothetical protein
LWFAKSARLHRNLLDHIAEKILLLKPANLRGITASTFTPRRATALRNMESSATLPASSTADQGKTNAGNELNAG